MTDPANPHGYVGGWVLYATRCGHPLSYADTQLQCALFWHDYDQDDEAGDLPQHSDTRPATQADVDAIRRGDACELCRVTARTGDIATSDRA